MHPFDLTVVMYHYIRDPGDAAEAGSGIRGLPVAAFEAQLDLLMRHYTLVSWPAVRAHLLGQQPLPARACLLTFDDGVCDHYLNAFPRLRERGLSGLFFALARPAGAGLAMPHQLHFLLARLGPAALRQAVEAGLPAGARRRLEQSAAAYYAGALPFALQDARASFKAALQRELCAEVAERVGRLFAEHIGPDREFAACFYLSPAQVAEMLAGGMSFGGHSQSHPWLDFIGAAELARELAASAAWLQSLGPGPWPFAYPYGGYDERTPPALQSAGFCAAFTTRAHVRQESAFHLGRLDGEALPPAGQADAAWLALGGVHA